ncbi:MAG TPA: hypothetical protein VKT77_23840 [Chthonomonadaceae bacterium]|nr:hypothetical protein [Chthonomonadaceae bacterium]
MAHTAIMFPILPGKRERLFEFAKALSGPRKAEYAESQTSVAWETWHLQSTPMGDFLIVSFEAPNPEAVFASLAESTSPFDVWFREQAGEISGLDLSQPIGTLPQLVFQYEK